MLCFGEKSKQLVRGESKPIRPVLNKRGCYHYEYKHNSVANTFIILEFLAVFHIHVN